MDGAPPAAGAARNRLAGEISPYLLAHRDDPVAWQPWGEEALARARAEARPIFLSVGYATCHWCHVMQRESFRDPEVAALLNDSFVSVKLDREERPELDEIYMAATQLLTHQGGWPNSVFLTPDLRPYFAGTYFPPQDGHDRPSFRTVVASMAHAWRERRSEVEMQAEELVEVMRRFLTERGAPGEAPPPAAVAERSLAALAERFDAEHGGFGAAPKFPYPANLLLLDAFAEERPEAASMLAVTLERMARGGVCDQLAGGFHRYATDRAWKVPHFEKMLGDNGLLLEVYARAFARGRDPELGRVVRATADFLTRELSGPEGELWSAIDAESEGQEGAYYRWRLGELAAVLGEEDAGFLAPILGYDGPPALGEDGYVLHLPQSLAEQAARRRLDLGRLRDEVDAARVRLHAARSRRPRPRTDDKVLTDWNGMAIAGLARAGRALGDAAVLGAAAAAADFVLARLRPAGGPLHHCWRAGEARVPALLADYAFLIRGLLALHDAAGDGRWLAAAAELAAEQHDRLADPAGGYFTAAAAPDLLCRSKDVFDGAHPAANPIAALNLVDLAERTGDRRWSAAAADTLCAFAATAEERPDVARTLCLAAWRFHRRG